MPEFEGTGKHKEVIRCFFEQSLAYTKPIHNQCANLKIQERFEIACEP